MFLVHFRGPAGPRRPPDPYGNYGPRGNYDPPTSIQAFTIWLAIAGLWSAMSGHGLPYPERQFIRHCRCLNNGGGATRAVISIGGRDPVGVQQGPGNPPKT